MVSILSGCSMAEKNSFIQFDGSLKKLNAIPVDIEVDSYEEYESTIIQGIKDKKNQLSIRISNFDKERFNDAPAKIGSRYNVLYSGYSYDGDYSGKVGVIKFNFSYLTAEAVGGEHLLPDNTPIVIDSYEQYCSELVKALSNFKTKLTFRINNYDESYSLSVVNKYWEMEPLNYSNGIAIEGNSLSDGSEGRILVISIKYLDVNANVLLPEDMEKWRISSQNSAQEIINLVIKPGMTDLQKEKALHDYVVKNADYKENGATSHIDYGVLVEKEGVCESYAKAMYRLLSMVGIPCKLVNGKADGVEHQWNMVQIEGKWYHLDATWNDPIGAPKGYITHEYFNISEEQMRKDHSW
jgi:hypothetical protein